MNRKKLILSGLLLGVGLLLACYPFISNWQYQHRTDKVIAEYNTELDGADSSDLQTILNAAQQYNEGLFGSSVILTDPFSTTAPKQNSNYGQLLNMDSAGVMGYIEIPKIQVYLPIYHGTGNAVLEQGIGHLEGSSLPVGGPSTRSVLTGHTGHNRAKLFTDLVELEQGDLFFLHIFQQTLAYRVEQIEVVKPDDACLTIVPGQDLCTLVTCTPYGINSHRLLVTGKRTNYTESLYTSAQVEPEAPSQWMGEYRRSLCLALLFVAAAYLVTTLVEKRLHHE